MIFLCYPKCTTCQKAKKFLDENNIQYELRDIKEDNPSVEELKKWHELSKADSKKFFNTSGMAYRALNLKDKVKEMTDEERLNLLGTDGMLVKRPLLILEDNVLIGFKQKEWEEILG